MSICGERNMHTRAQLRSRLVSSRLSLVPCHAMPCHAMPRREEPRISMLVCTSTYDAPTHSQQKLLTLRRYTNKRYVHIVVDTEGLRSRVRVPTEYSVQLPINLHRPSPSQPYSVRTNESYLSVLVRLHARLRKHNTLKTP